MTYNDYFHDIKWVWFDLDDTLFDFKNASLVALEEIYNQFGLDAYFSSLHQWVDLYHEHNYALWELYNRAAITQEQLRHDRFYLPLRDVGVDVETIDRLNPLLDKAYLDTLGRQPMPVEGAVEIIDAVHAAGMKVGILSNGFRGVQHAKLNSLGISEKVDCMVLSDEIAINKPDPRLYAYALEKSGATAANSLMVGDNPATDIAGALAAGWRGLLFGVEASEVVNVPCAATLAEVRKLIVD